MVYRVLGGLGVGDDENVLKLSVVILAQLCHNIKNH